VEADHQESSPDAAMPIISKLSCSLVGQTGTVKIERESLAFESYSADAVQEEFACNYGVNPLYQDRLRANDLWVSGYDEEGAIRIVEIKSHPFFMATLFLPQMRSRAEKPHPLIVAYLRAAQQFRR